MPIIIRLSKEGQAAVKAIPDEERPRVVHGNEILWYIPTDCTPEQQAVIAALHLQQGGSFSLGNFAQSSLTRAPIVRPIYYDAPPGDTEIWQQLTTMAAQYDTCANDAITAF